MKLHKIYFCILALISISCKEKATDPAFAESYEKWQSSQLHNYTIEQTRQCFCIHGGEKMRVIVRSDTVAKVVRLSDNTELNASESKWYLTIDSLFSIIHHSVNDSLEVTYNNKFGYPEKLDINPQLHPVDGGVLFITTNLQTP